MSPLDVALEHPDELLTLGLGKTRVSDHAFSLKFLEMKKWNDPEVVRKIVVEGVVVVEVLWVCSWRKDVYLSGFEIAKIYWAVVDDAFLPNRCSAPKFPVIKRTS